MEWVVTLGSVWFGGAVMTSLNLKNRSRNNKRQSLMLKTVDVDEQYEYYLDAFPLALDFPPVDVSLLVDMSSPMYLYQSATDTLRKVVYRTIVGIYFHLLIFLAPL